LSDERLPPASLISRRVCEHHSLGVNVDISILAMKAWSSYRRTSGLARGARRRRVAEVPGPARRAHGLVFGDLCLGHLALGMFNLTCNAILLASEQVERYRVRIGHLDQPHALAVQAGRVACGSANCTNSPQLAW
jgi:hypothetical protein